MISYRFRRRTFLAGLAGGAGLKIMLRNMEASAETAKSPPRLLVTKWPLGIIPGAGAALWTPTSGAVGGYALQTFADNGLGDDMISLRVSTGSVPLNGGGSVEGPSVVLVTGVGCGGTRANRGESDDAIAAGPSVDQILLRNAPGLRAPGGSGYANSIGDLRTDLGEVSSKVLSYAYEQQPVPLYNGSTGTENVPLMPVLSPLDQYKNLFSTFAPGTPAGDAMLGQLARKRSVLDFAMGELNRMRAVVPGEARQRLQIHHDAVQTLEQQLTAHINARYPVVTGGGGAGGTGGTTTVTGTCATKPAAPPDIHGDPDWTTGAHGRYGSPWVDAKDDTETHRTAGRLHMEVLRAAFMCDLIRCGTFNWAPPSGHVAFQGMYPGDDARPYGHSAVHHSVPSGGSPTVGTTPDELTNPAIRFLYNVQVWYFARQAENVRLWKAAVDGFGNPLLDTTVIPFVTESATYAHDRLNIAAMLFGGKKLGLLLGQYKAGPFSVNALWGTIARAVGYDPATTPDDRVSTAPLREPIPGLWSPPPDG